MNVFDDGGGRPKRARPNLYDLLPTIYRRRDDEVYAVDKSGVRAHDLLAVIDSSRADTRTLADTHVAPLKALFAILQRPFEELESAIAALYDDWFVETCSEEMLPLIAEPLAIRDLEALRKGHADLRAVIANIVDHRRRKGVARALEELGSEATGWTVQLTDGLESLALTPRMHPQAARRAGFVDLRRRPPGAPASGTAASGAAEAPAVTSADVRAAGGGVRAATIDVLRTKGAPVTGVEPGWPDPAEPRRRTFSPLGDDDLLMRPASSGGGDDDTRSFVKPLTRAGARADLARTGRIAGLAVRELHWVGAGEPPLLVADLSQWHVPARAGAAPRTVYVDPELGRLLVPDEGRLYDVDYTIVAHDGIGAAPVSRPWPGTFDQTFLVAPADTSPGRGRSRRLEAQLLSRILGDTACFTAYRRTLNALDFDAYFEEWAFIQDFYERSIDAAHDPPRRVPTAGELGRRFPSFPYSPTVLSTDRLIARLAQARSDARGTEAADAHGRVERFGSLSGALAAAARAHGAVRIVLATSRTLRSPCGWMFAPGAGLTALSIEAAPGARPAIDGELVLAPAEHALPVRLLGIDLRGPLVCGALADLTVERSTLRPARGRGESVALDRIGDGGPARPVTVRFSYLGGARLSDATELIVEDSVVTDPVVKAEQNALGPQITARRSTFLGAVDAYRLTASDVLFDAAVRAEDRAHGYLRYCAIRSTEQLPQRYKCIVANEQVLISTKYGRRGFARVRDDARIRTASSEGSEIGAYGAYADAARRANLMSVIEEFLPERVAARVRYLT